jgi:cyclase
MIPKITWLGIFLTLGSLNLSRAQSTEPPPVRLCGISGHLYQVLDGRGARDGAFIGDDYVVLIDCKMDQTSVEQTLSTLKKVTTKPVKYVVNTHSDRDHVGGNIYMPEGVIFISHENCRKEFYLPGRDGKPSEWNKPELSRFIPSITFREKMELYSGARKLELWYFGIGHTTGDAVVYFPEEKAAFLGDQLFLTRPQLIHSYKGGHSFGHVKTLEKMLATLDANTFYSGHSDPASRQEVEQHIVQIKALQEKIGDFIKQKAGLETIKQSFNKEEAGLVESIYNEIQARSR